MKLINYKDLMKYNPTELGSISNCKGQHITLFEHPLHGEESSIVGCINEVAFYTGFSDPSEFGSMSEYNPVLLDDGTVVCEFELERS